MCEEILRYYSYEFAVICKVTEKVNTKSIIYYYPGSKLKEVNMPRSHILNKVMIKDMVKASLNIIKFFEARLPKVFTFLSLCR